VSLVGWIPSRIQEHIDVRMGVIPALASRHQRIEYSGDRARFAETIQRHIDTNPSNFEVFSFAVIKVHLERFAYRIYRDTRTSAHDSGVDLSTNYGVVYQIKKLRLYSLATADAICAELRMNFDKDRLSDGNVVIVIDDISKEVKDYLIDMKVQSITKGDVLRLASQFEDAEDREKVLRIVYDEFRREYCSAISEPETEKQS
jgi:hypothetical protein